MDSVPGVIGKLLRQYGWLLGLRMALSGAALTVMGILARTATRSMLSPFSGLTNTMLPGGIPVKPGPGSDGGFTMESSIDFFSLSHSPVYIFTTAFLIIGILLMIAGVILAIVLKKQDKK